MKQSIPRMKAALFTSILLVAVIGILSAQDAEDNKTIPPGGNDDLSPCRVIGDSQNPRFSALWVTAEGVWAADDLNQSLILYDRSSGREKKRIQGPRTGIDFPVAVQFDPTFTFPDGKRGAIWASMNDTSDRVVAFSLDDGDPLDRSKMDVAPRALIDFNKIRFDGKEIYDQDRAYGFYADAQNDEVAVSVEKENFVHAEDGHSSLGSVVILDRGGGNPSRMGVGKRWIRGPHTGIANPHGVWIDTQNNELYVTHYGHLPSRAPQPPSITVYDRLANGDAVPKRTIQGSRTGLGMPVKVFVDNKNNELVVADDQAGVFVFDRLANGNVGPKRMIRSHDMPSGVFVDEAHDELVVTNWSKRTIEFYPRAWNPADHQPKPKRKIAVNPHVPVVGIGNPGALAFARDEIIVPNCVSHPGLAFYDRDANLVAAPKRLIEGNKTQMSRSIHGLAVYKHPKNPAQDEVFVPKPIGDAILVFNRTDKGNVAPKRVIQGPATRLDGPDSVAVDAKEVATFSRPGDILIFPRLGKGNIAPIRRITYLPGTKDPATGKWLGPWGERSNIRRGPAIWFDDKGTADPKDDEVVVRTSYRIRTPKGGVTQYVIAFFPRNANGPTVPKRIIASRHLTGIHQITISGREAFSAMPGVRATYPPNLGAVAVFDTAQTSTLNPDGTLSYIVPKRFLQDADPVQGGLSGVRHPRAVAIDPVRREIYIGDSKSNDIRVFRVDWQKEECLPVSGHASGPPAHVGGH